MRPYIPDNLPLQDLDLRRLLPFVGRANAALARYDGHLHAIPNPEIMLSPLTTREAVLSSKIEGTQATVDQVLEHGAGIKHAGELGKDIDEILNYRKALRISKQSIHNAPIRLQLVCQLHAILMDGVRGRHKSPGSFRKEQNWIGRPGSTMENAIFVPPTPLQLQDHLDAWEAYTRSDDLDVLIQTAVMHAQFELLHPFKDGNGRIGRLLIPLFLYQKNALSEPMFYLSEYLETNRREYYARLKAISEERDWDGWIEFFLKAVIEQAEFNSRRTLAIRHLYETMKRQIQELTHSQYAPYVLDGIFNDPVFATTTLANQIAEAHDLNDKTVATLIRRLRDEGVLHEIQPAAGSRSAYMAFTQLLEIAGADFSMAAQ